MSDTPETDRKQGLFECFSCGDRVVPADFARRLERERNEARSQFHVVREALCDALPKSNHPTLELAKMLQRERDEWKTKATLHGNAALDLESDLKAASEERDELREALTILTAAVEDGAFSNGEWDQAKLEIAQYALDRKRDSEPQPWACSKCGATTRNPHGYCDPCTGAGEEAKP